MTDRTPPNAREGALPGDRPLPSRARAGRPDAGRVDAVAWTGRAGAEPPVRVGRRSVLRDRPLTSTVLLSDDAVVEAAAAEVELGALVADVGQRGERRRRSGGRWRRPMRGLRDPRSTARRATVVGRPCGRGDRAPRRQGVAGGDRRPASGARWRRAAIAAAALVGLVPVGVLAFANGTRRGRAGRRARRRPSFRLRRDGRPRRAAPRTFDVGHAVAPDAGERLALRVAGARALVLLGDDDVAEVACGDDRGGRALFALDRADPTARRSCRWGTPRPAVRCCCCPARGASR